MVVEVREQARSYGEIGLGCDGGRGSRASSLLRGDQK